MSDVEPVIFTKGADLTPEETRAIFGLEPDELAARTRGGGSAVITSIDREAGVLTCEPSVAALCATPVLEPLERIRNPGRKANAAEEWDRTAVYATKAVELGRPNRRTRRRDARVNLTRAQRAAAR